MCWQSSGAGLSLSPGEPVPAGPAGAAKGFGFSVCLFKSFYSWHCCRSLKEKLSCAGKNKPGLIWLVYLCCFKERSLGWVPAGGLQTRVFQSQGGGEKKKENPAVASFGFLIFGFVCFSQQICTHLTSATQGQDIGDSQKFRIH